jgi:hypothetical protein
MARRRVIHVPFGPPCDVTAEDSDAVFQEPSSPDAHWEPETIDPSILYSSELQADDLPSIAPFLPNPNTDNGPSEATYPREWLIQEVMPVPFD